MCPFSDTWMLSILDIPVLGGKGSPKKFKGDHTKVATFLDHYDQLCTQFYINKSSDKCKAILQYCGRQVREIIEGLDSFWSGNYTLLQQDLLEIYDDELMRKRYKQRDMEDLVKKWRKMKIKRLGDFRKYEREFIWIVGWLRAEEKISENEYNDNFWKGLPGRFCRDLEWRLVALFPSHDMWKAWAVDQVVKVAEKALQRDL